NPSGNTSNPSGNTDTLIAPTDLNTTKNDNGSYTITGKGTPGATVTINNPAGTKIGEGTVGTDGSFTVTIPAGSAKAGDKVSVIQAKDGKTSQQQQSPFLLTSQLTLASTLALMVTRT
uniref:Ig-like domain-containing protein n=1 Tax=Lacticaseibacillus pantheris TaxID=171523 RepID=UPI000AB71F0B